MPAVLVLVGAEGAKYGTLSHDGTTLTYTANAGVGFAVDTVDYTMTDNWGVTSTSTLVVVIGEPGLNADVGSTGDDLVVWAQGPTCGLGISFLVGLSTGCVFLTSGRHYPD